MQENVFLSEKKRKKRIFCQIERKVSLIWDIKKNET